jgi:hypothetical protein
MGKLNATFRRLIVGSKAHVVRLLAVTALPGKFGGRPGFHDVPGAFPHIQLD